MSIQSTEKLKRRKKRKSRKYDRSRNWITKTKRFAIYLRDDFQCCWCEKDLKDSNHRNITLDHLIPRSVANNNEPSNLVTACLQCNSKRKNKAWTKFKPHRINHIRVQIKKKLNVELAKYFIDAKKNDGINDPPSTNTVIFSVATE